MHNIRRKRGPSLAFALVLACLPLGPAVAQSTFHFDIQDQSLSQALQSYGRISGQQIVFTENLVFGKDSPSLTGEFAAEAALEQLLHGSGLVAERSPSGVIMIRRQPVHSQSTTPDRERSLAPPPPRLVDPEEDFGRAGVYLYPGHPVKGSGGV